MSTGNQSESPAAPGTHSEEIAAIHARLDAGYARMARIEQSLKANTEATERVESNTREVIGLFALAANGFKALEGLGKLAKPVAAILGLGAAALSLWAAFKGVFK
jgi:hypothetical protein